MKSSFSRKIYPQTSNERPLTRLQERLIKKLGQHAFPFYFEVPPHCPASVSLQPAPGDTGKPCGVDYELKAFVGEHIDDKPHKRNSVRLAIRKIMYAPSKLGEQPSIEVSKEFMLKPNKIHLEASLDKEVSVCCYCENQIRKENLRAENYDTFRCSKQQLSEMCPQSEF